MAFVYSPDGINVEKEFHRNEPTTHWVQDTPITGRYVDANQVSGYYPLIKVDSPSVDHIRTVERQGDTFIEVWTFSQEMADARIARDAADVISESRRTNRDTIEAALSASLTSMQTIIDQATGAQKAVAVAVKRLIRLQLDELDSAD